MYIYINTDYLYIFMAELSFSLSRLFYLIKPLKLLPQKISSECVCVCVRVVWIFRHKKLHSILALCWLGLRFYPFLISLEGLLGESIGLALLLSVYLGTRCGWEVSTAPRPPCPRERPGTHCTGGGVGLGAGLDRCEKSRPHRNSTPGPSSP
jgi:hypothetical protein